MLRQPEIDAVNLRFPPSLPNTLYNSMQQRSLPRHRKTALLFFFFYGTKLLMS